MLYYIYVLQNKNRFYVGLTQDVTGRYINAHLTGQCISSKKLGNLQDLKLIYHWMCDGYITASKLERAIHKLQIQHGEDIVLEFIKQMPQYTKEYQTLINSQLLTTSYEENKEDTDDDAYINPYDISEDEALELNDNLFKI